MSVQAPMDEAAILRGRQGALRLVAAGAAVGALWGVVARAWMRFITADPEFSWSGTLTIVGIFAVFGIGQAIALAARRGRWTGRARAGSQVAAVATTLPLGMGAGMMMMPSTVLAAVAIGRTQMKRWGRLALGALAFIPTLGVLSQLLNDLPAWRAVVGWLLMFVIYLPMSWVLGWTMRTLGPEDRPLSRRAKTVLAVVGVAVAVIVVVLTGGIV